MTVLKVTNSHTVQYKGNSGPTTLDRATTSLTLQSITSSTCTSHFSTAPLASDVEICWISWTRSPSLLYMAYEKTVQSLIKSHESLWYIRVGNVCECLAWISRLGRKSNLEIPSKHFFRWGCTRSGSLVSDRISSISSLDKKKNLAAVAVRNMTSCDFFNKELVKKTQKHVYRGKKRRFFSRYAFSPFMIFSKRLLQFCSFSSKPGNEVAGRIWLQIIN